MRRLLTALALALASPALAQDASGPVAVGVAPPQSPLEQALSEKLLNELYLGVQCRQQSIAMYQQAQAEIAALKKQIEELKKK